MNKENLKDLNLYNEINLYLVIKKARKVALLNFTSNGLKKAKKDFPELIFTSSEEINEIFFGLINNDLPGYEKKEEGYFVSCKKLPKINKNESRHHYYGRILDYQDPKNTIRDKNYKYYVEYNAIFDNYTLNFYSEAIKIKSKYKSKLDKFAKVLELLDYGIEEVIIPI